MVYADIYTYLWSVWGGVWEEWLCRRDKQASPESPAWEELEELERSGCTAQQQQPWPGRWAESSALQVAAGRGRDRMRGSISVRHKLNLCPKRRRDVKVIEVLTGKFSFCWRAAFFFQSLSLSSATLLSMVAISPFFLFRFSLCCWSLALCS